MLDQLLPILFMGIFVSVFGVGLLAVASLVGPKNTPSSKAKRAPYESGIYGESAGTTKVPIKYYLIAILFIVFDIEAIFLYPWAIVFRDFIAEGLGTFLFIEMGVFIATLLYGLFYIWKSGALDWE